MYNNGTRSGGLSRRKLLGCAAFEGDEAEALVESDVEVRQVEPDAVDRAGLAGVRVLRVGHRHRVLLSHVPEPDEAVPGGAAD